MSLFFIHVLYVVLGFKKLDMNTAIWLRTVNYQCTVCRTTNFVLRVRNQCIAFVLCCIILFSVVLVTGHNTDDMASCFKWLFRVTAFYRSV